MRTGHLPGWQGRVVRCQRRSQAIFEALQLIGPDPRLAALLAPCFEECASHGVETQEQALRWIGQKIKQAKVANEGGRRWTRMNSDPVLEAREVIASVVLQESLYIYTCAQELYSKIFPRNVTSFSYRYKDDTDAYIFMSFQSSDGPEDVASVIQDLDESGYVVTNLSENEMAKVHGRYLCGGRSGTAEDTHHELLYRFEFPERPGALKRFLDTLSQGSAGWNVSLFHYRYHGADIGRVLVGVQVPAGMEESWQGFLDDLGYVYHNEQDNRVYRQFLK